MFVASSGTWQTSLLSAQVDDPELEPDRTTSPAELVTVVLHVPENWPDKHVKLEAMDVA
jgi:hypothetical protein